ncbi:MAG TPA: EamA family transporter [Stellaceae bacterium]|nr:EamA family transporter [Stellaceae bacterium]
MSVVKLDRGIILALVAAALFGASTPVAKVLLGSLDPWLLAGLLYLGSGLGLGAMRLLRRRGEEASLRRADLPWLAAVIAFGGVVGPILLMYGLRATEAASASFLLNLEGVFTVVIAWTLFRENVDWSVGIGAAAILAGAALLSWQPGSASGIGWGALAIAGACLCWAIDNNLTRKLSAADPIEIAMTKGLAAGAIDVAIALSFGAEVSISPALPIGALVGFLGYGVSLVCFVLALRHLGTARTGAYFSLAPFIGAGIAIAFLGEAVTLRFGVAAGLMSLGLWLHLRERHEHEHVHEAIEHTHRHRHDAHHQHEHAPADPPGEPHSHPHRHIRLVHSHPHYPDLHHRHTHP